MEDINNFIKDIKDELKKDKEVGSFILGFESLIKNMGAENVIKRKFDEGIQTMKERVKEAEAKGEVNPYAEILEKNFGEILKDVVVKKSYMSLNTLETDKKYVLFFDIPGMKDKSDIELLVNGDELSVSGERIVPDFKIQESYSGPFKRTVKLPEDVQLEEISATYINGVLEITLLKNKSKNIKVDIK